MPIEIYPGKTGDRLIARLPVDPNAFAEIYLEDATRFYFVRAAYQGGESSGYPALSPVMALLPEVIQRRIETERSDLIDRASRRLSSKYSQEVHDTAEEQIAAYQAGVPVLSSIKIGVSLQIILPGYFPTTRYRLRGTVHSWDISN